MSSRTFDRYIPKRKYRERAQPQRREHLGILEKKKDYIQRAKDYHSKQSELKSLKQKSRFKNPQQFYFQMVNEKTKDGIFSQRKRSLVRSQKQAKLQQNHDLNLLNMKKQITLQKKERLKKELQFLDEAPKLNKHIFFADNQEEIGKIRKEIEDSKRERFSGDDDDDELQLRSKKKLLQKRKQSYNQLFLQSQQHQKLEEVHQVLNRQKILRGKGKKKKIGTTSKNEPVFKFFKERSK